MTSPNEASLSSCIIHNVHGSNFANMMIKFLCAQKLKNMSEDAQLSNYHMPLWGISFPPLSSHIGLQIDFTDDQRIDLVRASYVINGGYVSQCNLHGHYQRMEYLPSRLDANKQFNAPAELGVEFGSEFLVCPIRGAEILEAIHPGYPLIPIEFYRDMIEQTGLTPVFMGQLDDNIYIARLKAEFPSAIYVPSQGQLPDFQTIRRARNIVLPVSTFAWLAAWLSNANQIIIPVFGLFNPKQYPNHDLLPVHDLRYKFFQFPIHHAVPVDQFAEAHAGLLGSWEQHDAQHYICL